MGIDSKYGRVTVEHVRNRPIGEDEPVVLFRAQDKLLTKVLTMYGLLAEAAGSPPEHLRLIEDTKANVANWQAANATQTPGSHELR